MKNIYNFIDKLRASLLVLISSLTVTLCFIQIILRYFTFISLRPFPWGDEIIRLSSIWIIFLGISLGIKENAHFFVDFFLNKISDKKKLKLVTLVTDLIVLFIFSIIVFEGFKYALTNTTSMLQNIKISMSLFYLAIPIGSLLCIFEYVLKMIYGTNYKEILQQKGDK